MKRLILSLMLLAACGPALAQETRIAAVVNDDVISVADLATRIRLVFASSSIQNTPQNEQRLRGQILKILVDEKLELQEGARLNIKASDADIAEALGKIEQQNNVPKGGLDKFLAAHGIERAALVSQITPVIVWGKVVRQSVSQLATVSEEEIDAAAARLRETADEPKLRLGEIFLAVDNPQQEDEVHRFPDRLYDQIRGGGDYAAIARQFSQSATAAVGGDVGWVTPSQLSPEIAQGVAKLGSHQLAPPIRAACGYQFDLVIDRQAASSTAGDDMAVSLTQVMFPLAANAPDAERQRVTAQAESAGKEARSCGELAEIGRRVAPQT